MEVFAWKQEDIGGVDSAVITHRLNVNLFFKPAKQKRRSFTQKDRRRLMKRSASSSKQRQSKKWNTQNGWLTLFSSKKQTASGGFASIDLIVDVTTGHELLSFMDAFSAYNQISMDPSDQEKTSFVTGQGTYCYQVTPFGLKNAGATYQRLVNKMFHKQIRASMEVYIDDMLVKSVKVELHITHLAEVFQVLKSYNMKLNPAKCAFGVSAGKFLGFIVNSRGIEANPDKIKVVLNMLPPSNIKDIQRLTGRIAALSHFISKTSDKCQPFFQVLKKAF